jgi:TolB-like protein
MGLLEAFQILVDRLKGIPKTVAASIPVLTAVTALLVAINDTGALVAPAFKRQIDLPVISEGNVLAAPPLINLSMEPADETISRGLTVAINNALFRIRNARVVASSSAARLLTQNADTAELERTLGITHRIEGSVYRLDSKLVATVELVQVSNRTRMWSSSYDVNSCNQIDPPCDELRHQGDLAEGIARSIAAELKLQIRSPEVETKDYQDAELLVKERSGGMLPAIKLLTEKMQSGERLPSLSTWELLAYAYRLRIPYEPRAKDEVIKVTRNETCKFAPYKDNRIETLNYRTEPLTGARRTAEKVLSIDRDSAIGHAVLAAVKAQCGDWAGAMHEGRTAFNLDPNDPRILHDFSQILTILGYVREALEQRERLTKLAPEVVPYNLVTADILAISGRRLEAIRALERLPEQGPPNYFRSIFLARAYASVGRYSWAADTLRHIKGEDQVKAKSVEEAVRLLREQAPLRQTPPFTDDLEGELNFVYLYIGSPAEIVLANNAEYVAKTTMLATGMRALWLPEFRTVRQTRTFKELIRAAGIDTFWRRNNWPDLCRPDGPDDFVCS